MKIKKSTSIKTTV